MRNTQPLLASTAPGGRGDWKEPKLYTRFIALPDVRGASALLKRLRSSLKDILLFSRGWDSKGAYPKNGQTLQGRPAPPDEAYNQFVGDLGCHGRDRSVEVTGFTSPRWKRFMDIALVISTLPFWLALMILVTLWIKVVSPGPTFYRQERIGYRGRRFMLLKFRSMRVNAETQSHEQHCSYLIKANAPMAKLDGAGDPRLIVGGRFLRALAFDELPQMINVLRGEMSLVGPRPCTAVEFEQYDCWHKERVKVPPGLTGFWQVNGKNSTTFTEMIAMDVFYAEHMSLCLDCEIILRTTGAIATQALETHMKRRLRP